MAGCTSDPCNVVQGNTANMQVDFRAPHAATGLRPVVFATALGQTIQYQLEPQFHNACNHLIGTSCPLSAGEDATYRFAFHVTPIYPPIRVLVELSLVDHANRPQFCTVIPIHVRTR